MLLINKIGLKVWEYTERLWLLFQLNLEINEVSQFWLIQNNNNKKFWLISCSISRLIVTDHVTLSGFFSSVEADKALWIISDHTGEHDHQLLFM